MLKAEFVYFVLQVHEEQPAALNNEILVFLNGALRKA